MLKMDGIDMIPDLPNKTVLSRSASLAYVLDICHYVSSGGMRLFFIASV